MIKQLDSTRCSELPELENALLWCMRAWVIGHCHHRNVAGRIETVFVELGAAWAAANCEPRRLHVGLEPANPAND